MSIITSIIIIAVASNTNTKGGARCITMTIFPTLMKEKEEEWFYFIQEANFHFIDKQLLI